MDLIVYAPRGVAGVVQPTPNNIVPLMPKKRRQFLSVATTVHIYTEILLAKKKKLPLFLCAVITISRTWTS